MVQGVKLVLWHRQMRAWRKKKQKKRLNNLCATEAHSSRTAGSCWFIDICA